MFSVAQRSKTIMDSLAVYISYTIIMQSYFKSFHDPDREKHRNHSRILSQPEAYVRYISYYKKSFEISVISPDN